MICLLAFSLLLLGSKAYGQDCIDTAEEYTTHLGELLNDANAMQKPLCGEHQLMTRIQGLGNKDNWPKLPESLNQYGGYWTFASGPDVAGHFLDLAKANTGNMAGFIEEALYYLGFGAGDIDMSGYTKYVLVVFDESAMDVQWQAGVPDGNYPYHLFQPTWGEVFVYLENKFQLCHNPNSPSPDLDTVSRPEDCTSTTAVISEESRVKILSTPYSDLTGCNEGYRPMVDLRGETRDSCTDRCPGTNGVAYCNATQILQSASYQGSIECIDTFNMDYTLDMDETLWARAFFEKCLSFNPWFTGLGVGYSPVTQMTTGTEFLVRGDVALADLKFSRFALTEWS